MSRYSEKTLAGIALFILAIFSMNLFAESGSIPRPDHVVIVIGENTSFGSVVGNQRAPYINSLAERGALFTQYFHIRRPSLPNYIALFSGSTQGFPDNKCSRKSSRPNLYTSLNDAGLTFIGFAEGLPFVGFAGCHKGGYQKKHTPWAHFTNVPGSVSHPLADFPTDFTQLPTIAMVIPTGGHQEPLRNFDKFLRTNLDAYAIWAQTNNSLLIVTFDEASKSSNDRRIATIIVGQPVQPGRYAERLNHYNLLRTLEEMYGLPLLEMSATADPITNIWAPVAAPSSASPAPEDEF